MAKVVKVTLSDEMVRDLEELQEILGTQTRAETLRRIVASEKALREQLEKSKTVKIRGKNAGGGETEVLLV